MTDRILTINEAGYLADLIRAVEAGARLRYYPDGSNTDRPITAVLRAFTNQDGTLYPHDADIRDAHVHTSGMFERWLKVSDVLTALDNAVNARHGWDKPMASIESRPAS